MIGPAVALLLAASAAATPTATLGTCNLQQAKADAKIVRQTAVKPLAVDIIAKWPDLILTAAIDYEFTRCSAGLAVVHNATLLTSDGYLLERGEVVPQDDRFSAFDPAGIWRPEGVRSETIINLIAHGAWAGVRQTRGEAELLVFKNNKILGSLLTSSKPLLGGFYLPCPDCRGGRFTLWQKVADKHYRELTFDWREGLLYPEL